MDKNNLIVKSVLKCKDEIKVYKPSKNKIIKWFHILNKHIFKGKLKLFRNIKIKKMKDEWAITYGRMGGGVVFCDLEISNKFPNLKEFIDTLGHEMIHLYQWTVLDRNLDHGRTFKEWKRVFSKFGLPLREEGLQKHNKILRNN